MASAFKLSLRVMDPLQLLLWSCVFSLATLLLILAAQGAWGCSRPWAAASGWGPPGWGS